MNRLLSMRNEKSESTSKKGNYPAATTFYEEVAGEYSTPIHRAFYRDIAEKLLETIPPCPIESILEIGSGSGYATTKISDRYPRARIVALEPSAAMSSHAQIATPNVYPLCKTLSDMPGENFNLVFASMSYHWLDREEREKAMALGKNGMLAVALPVTDSRAGSALAQALGRELFKFRGDNNWPKRVRRENAVLADLKDQFKMVNVSDLNIRETFENTADLVDCLYVRGALFSLFGNQAKTVAGELKRRSKETSGNIEFFWSIKLITARN
jgi:trans-aconitate methyltransferase